MINKNIFNVKIYGNKINKKEPLSRTEIFKELCGQILITKSTDFLILFTPRLSRKTAMGKPYKGYVNIRINSTEYYLNPDGSRSYGISNITSPIPDNETQQTDKPSSNYLYILPGQTFEFVFTLDKDSKLMDDDYIEIMIPYVLLTNKDASEAEALRHKDRSILDYIKDVITYRRSILDYIKDVITYRTTDDKVKSLISELREELRRSDSN